MAVTKLSIRLFAGFTLAASSLARAGYDTRMMSFQIDGWVMIPIASETQLDYILAARLEDEAKSTDIDIVLYERDGADWFASAYPVSVTLEDALLDIQSEFSLNPYYYAYSDLKFDTSDVLDHILPREAFGNGFFTADPLSDVAAQMQDPEPLVAAVESAGGPAAGSITNYRIDFWRRNRRPRRASP